MRGLVSGWDWLGGWMHGWVGEFVGGWVGGRVDRFMDGLRVACMGGMLGNGWDAWKWVRVEGGGSRRLARWDGFGWSAMDRE